MCSTSKTSDGTAESRVLRRTAARPEAAAGGRGGRHGGIAAIPLARRTAGPADRTRLLQGRTTLTDVSAHAARSELVQSLSRGLAVIRAFEHQTARMTLTDVSNRTGLSRAVARRFLLTLVHDGYASTDGKRFALTPKILDLGFAFLSSTEIADLAQPALAELAVEINESCSASMLDGAEIIYVARAGAGRILQVGLSVGSRLPAFCTSMGRVLLSGLPEPELEGYFRGASFAARTGRTVVEPAELRRILARTREQGFALVDGELEPGLRSISVPILRRSGAMAAAATICTMETHRSLEDMRAVCLPALRAAAARIARGLAG